MTKTKQITPLAPWLAAGIFFSSLFFLFLSSTGCAQQERPKGEWISLFNGKDLDGWTPKFSGHPVGENVKNTFRVEDGVLKVCYNAWDQFDNVFGHLFYKDSFSHYRLRMEYRFVGDQVPGAPGWAFRNNGIMIHCQDPQSMALEQNFPVSIEMQLLGGDGEHERPTGNLCTPGTNVVINGDLIMKHCINSTSPTFHGDQWVTAEVEVHGDSLIRHYINGELVLQYEKPQLDARDPDAKRLIKDGDLTLNKGRIALQAESHPTEFRNIELLVLEE